MAMSNYDTQCLIGVGTKQQVVLLCPDDSVFVLLTLNRLALDRFVQRIKTATPLPHQIDAGGCQITC
jgi:hypothetical protein